MQSSPIPSAHSTTPSGSQQAGRGAGTESSDPVLNIAAYQFARLDGLESMRDELKQLSYRLRLKGTILLSPEGINLFIAGDSVGIERLLERLRQVPGLEGLTVKESFTSQQPFHRMLVKIKKEIIAFGIDSVKPAVHTSQKISAKELKQWLAEGKSLRLLDVRNDYEIELGTFEGAEDLDIKHFRHFPEEVAKWDCDRDQPVVMFCTGGIRCEKAGPYMEQLGFRNIFQLDGGILKYFEECGGDHYRGDCFVFDQRVAVGPDLKPTGVLACFACQATLTAEDIASPKYEVGVSCPKCYRDPSVRLQEAISARQTKLQAVAASQPGCQPYDSRRVVHVARRFAALPMIDFLCAYQPNIPRDEWLHELETGRLRLRGERISADRLVREGECFDHVQLGVREPDVASDILLVHEEEEWLVVDKPAPLPVHACGRFARNTLEYFLHQAYSPEKIRLVHRLDANTSGLLLVARRYRAAKRWQSIWENGMVSRTYLARVHGRPSQAEFECRASIAKTPTKLGARVTDEEGLEAVTRFRVLSTLDDGTSLIEAEPLTGRTNQIRVHLWHLNMPIVGDPLYLANHQFGTRSTLELMKDPMCLHASRLVISGWEEGRSLEFRSPRVLEWDPRS